MDLILRFTDPKSSAKFEHLKQDRRRSLMVGLFLLLGIICLILAPFTGITVVGAAAFFVIAYVLWKMGF